MYNNKIYHSYRYLRYKKHKIYYGITYMILNPLNAKLNPICHLLALLGAHHILHVSSIRVNTNNKITNIIHCRLTEHS
jgi:hypothetical protein